MNTTALERVVFFVGCKATGNRHVGFAFWEAGHNELVRLYGRMSGLGPESEIEGDLSAHPGWAEFAPQRWHRQENVEEEAPITVRAGTPGEQGVHTPLDEALLVTPEFAALTPPHMFDKESLRLRATGSDLAWQVRLTGDWTTTNRIHILDVVQGLLATSEPGQIYDIFVSHIMSLHPHWGLKLLERGVKVLPGGRDIAPHVSADILERYFFRYTDQIEWATRLLPRLGPASPDLERKLLSHSSRAVRAAAIAAFGRTSRRSVK